MVENGEALINLMVLGIPLPSKKSSIPMINFMELWVWFFGMPKSEVPIYAGGIGNFLKAISLYKAILNKGQGNIINGGLLQKGSLDP